MTEGTPRLFRLSEAIATFFPNTGLQERDLRREAKRGRLVLIRIGNREYVTEAALREMLEVCQERKAHPGSGPNAGQEGKQSGTSSTAAEKSALAFLNETLQQPKGRSRATSRKNTRQAENVVRPHFR